MDAQLPNEEKGAAARETLGHVNPNSPVMEAKSPAKESEVYDLRLSKASSAEASLIRRENEAADGLAMATEAKRGDEGIKEDGSMLEKDGPVDDKTVEAMEVGKAFPQTEGAETHYEEAVTNHEAGEACLHSPHDENAEITLVVEMNTDAEMAVESGLKGDGIKQEEADPSIKRGGLLQVEQQVGASECKEEGRDTTPAAIYEHAETSIIEIIPQERMGEVQAPDQKSGPADSDMHVEVETEDLAFDEGFRDGFLSENETKGLQRGGEQQQVHAEVPIRTDDEMSFIEENAGTTTGDLEAKAEGILNEGDQLPDAMEEVENDGGGRKGEAFGGCIEMVVEAGDTKKGCMVTDVEMEANTEPCVNEVSAGIADGEREKDSMVGQELAGLEGSNGRAKEMVDINRKEQESGSTTLQMEQGTNNISMENDVVHAESLQNCLLRDDVQDGEERADGTVVLTEAMPNKVVVQVEGPGQWSSTPIGMDANTIVSDKQRMNVNVFQHTEGDPGEGAKQGMQEVCHGTEADTSDAVPLQHRLELEGGAQLGIKDDECHQLLERNNESGKKAGREVLTDHVALHLNTDMAKAVDFEEVEQGGQRKKEGSGQDLHSSPAIQGPLQNLKSKNVVFETSGSEGDRRVQWEKQHNRHVHAEMQIRLMSDKSVKADLIKSHEALDGVPGMRMLKELPFSKSQEVKDDEVGASAGQHWRVGIVMQVKTKADKSVGERPKDTKIREVGFEQNQAWAFQGTGYEDAAHQIPRGGRAGMFEEEKTGMSDEANTGTSEEEKYLRGGFEKGNIIEKPNQKRKLSENLASDIGTVNDIGQNENVVKKSKKKAVNVWAKSSSRKGPKKNSKNGIPQNPSNEDTVLLTPVYVNPDKVEDGPDQPIALSKYDKAEKIELSENRLTASSTKGYRMVRATRGVQEGAWYFEVVVEQLGPTGHTRLGWSTPKGDVQAPVGFDSNSYGYRDLDGSKTHVAIREPYGDLYVEGDVIGFYINLPNGAEYAPKPAPLISYRGRPYLSDIKEEQPRKVPGSEICFFRNGVCQGTAFRDINAGRYFPAASMYTLPKEPSCIVRFNFGPEFRFPPVDIGDRPAPVAMVHAPFHNTLNGKEVGTVAWPNAPLTGNVSLNNEPQIKIV